MATSAQVQQLYITYFGRPADPTGLAYWTTDTATPIETIANGFASTPEFATDLEGRSLDQIVNSLYLDLFGRIAEPDGLAFWVQQIQSGSTTIQQAGLVIGNTALAAPPGNTDRVAVESKIAASEQWTAQIAASTQARLAYTGEVGIQAGVNYLTPVTTVATIPTEEATAAEVSALVQSNGSGSSNTLELTVLRDIASSTGTERLNAIGQVESSSTFRFNGQNQTVNGTATTFSGVAGGDLLTDTSTTDQDVLNLTNILGLAAIGGAGSQSTNIENINIALNGATSAGFANGVGAVTFANARTFTLTGTIAGNEGLNINNTGATSINSSALTGSLGNVLTLTTSNTASTVTGGAINENITTGTGNDTIDGGAGADTINSNAGTDSISGGDGNDNINAGSGSDTVAGGGGADTITGSTGADVVAGDAGADQFAVAANDSLAATAFSNAVVAGTYTFTFGSGVDIITDFSVAQGDLINYGVAGAVVNNNAGDANGGTTINEAAIYRGTWNASTGVFQAGDGTGNDLLTFVAGATRAANALTLADIGTQAQILLGAGGQTLALANFA